MTRTITSIVSKLKMRILTLTNKSILCSVVTLVVKRPWCPFVKVTQQHQQKERRLVFAMKCLRPQARYGHEQFMIGVDDLLKETTMLASLDHPNIIKIHGRGAGDKYHRITDGIFILLDRLTETLDQRITRWKNMDGKNETMRLTQIKVVVLIADAMSYLHSKMIIFCDLKPTNIGFDSSGTVKLFDFGFAVNVASNDSNTTEPQILYDQCGTPRYMAPETGLELGYSGCVLICSSGRYGHSRNRLVRSSQVKRCGRLYS
jgi:serine/threonine protein kinase